MRCGGFKAQDPQGRALNSHSKWPLQFFFFLVCSLAHRDDASASSREKNENSFSGIFLNKENFHSKKMLFFKKEIQQVVDIKSFLE